MRPPEDADFSMIDLFRAALPGRAIAFHMSGTFKLSWTLRGSLEQLLMDYVLDPDLAHSLARLTTDYDFEVIDKVAARGADFIILEGDLAYNPGPMMTRRITGNSSCPITGSFARLHTGAGSKSSSTATASLPRWCRF